MKAGILLFPGSNCDRDLDRVLKEIYQVDTEFLWHSDQFELKHDFYFVPGGFSYGDYLRSGAMAAQSKCIKSLREAASAGRKVVGICNGFQILTESHLLPGALVRNQGLHHICRWVTLSPSSVFKENIEKEYALPVSHSEGNYLCSDETLQELLQNDQVIFRYKEEVNGSTDNIAGIRNKQGNVFGLMPHPERAIFSQLDNQWGSSSNGRQFFDALFKLS